MLTEGMNIAERYEIIEKIGTGGMSDVYKAMDHLLGRFVAVKVLKSEFSEDTNFLTKFRTEAQAAAGLEHPNIVNIYDVGSENKMHYIVMEYVEGITLKTYIEKKEKLGFKETISIAIQTANGIRAAHNKNIVHRDIKPQNIIISTEGKVKVTDFGIARATTSNTISSDVMGSVHYTSPEQARNGYVDFKSDIYSLGIVMYEMATGKVPFNGESAVAVALQHLQEEIIRPSAYAPDLPISLEKIILKCTQKSPDRRYVSMDDLIVDLKKALINPMDDFVVLETNVAFAENTRVISEKEVEQIQQASRKKEVPTRENKVDYDPMESELLDEMDDEDDKLLNPKMEKAVTIMGIIAAIFMVVVVVLILGTVLDWFNFGKPNDPSDDPTTQVTQGSDQVEMIDVRGKTFEEAQKLLYDLGLGIQLQGAEESDDAEEGQILSQNIEEGTMIDRNTTIQVIVCAGKQGFELIDVKGKDEAEATSLLQSDPNNLVVNVKYEFDANLEAGKVVSMFPEAGNTVHAGDTITLVVSRGEETVKVPDVLGKTEAAAKEKLKAAGFSVTVVTRYDDSVKEGRVISQSIKGGDKIKPGATIEIVVSLGKETVYYSFKTTIERPSDIERGEAIYTARSCIIRLIVGGTEVYNTQTGSFPKTISFDKLTAASGKLELTWIYENEDDPDDVFEEREEQSVNFDRVQ